MTNRPRKPLVAKCVEMVYGYPGTLLKGWEAEYVNEDTYVLHRPNGTQRTINLHLPMATVSGEQIPYRNEDGFLSINEHSVLIGRNISHGMHARKVSRENAYLIFDESGRNTGEVKVGQLTEGMTVSLVDAHLLKVGEKNIPVMPKKYDIALIIMDSEYGAGRLSYINIIEKGHAANRKDGTRGEFLSPKTAEEPALFVESFEGEKVVTAKFYLSSKRKKVNYEFRDAEVALQESRLSLKIQDAYEKAVNAAIEPEDYHEYVELTEKMVEIQKQWKKSSMALVQGSDQVFKPQQPERGNNRDRREGPSP